MLLPEEVARQSFPGRQGSAGEEEEDDDEEEEEDDEAEACLAAPSNHPPGCYP